MPFFIHFSRHCPFKTHKIKKAGIEGGSVGQGPVITPRAGMILPSYSGHTLLFPPLSLTVQEVRERKMRSLAESRHKKNKEQDRNNSYRYTVGTRNMKQDIKKKQVKKKKKQDIKETR